MRRRPLTWLLASVVLFAAAVWCWRLGGPTARRTAGSKPASARLQPPAAPKPLPAVSSSRAIARLTNSSPLTYRVANTALTAGKLARKENAILLENALIDTDQKVELAIPEHLRAQGAAGTWIVQARGPIGEPFRAALRAAGAAIVAYVPNNAYLVRASESAALALKSAPLVQSVLAFEPYYKLKPALLEPAIRKEQLPEGTVLNLLLFADTSAATEGALTNGLRARILARERSPFGPMVRVTAPPEALTALAQLPGVQEMEVARVRVPANDLSRVTTGVAVDPIIQTNYLDLSGTNVTVGIFDTGVDTNHPDLLGRVFYDLPNSGVDFAGHGTFIAGIIAGNGAHSTDLTTVQGSLMPGSANQFRGKAPAASMFSTSLANGSDAALQEIAGAQTNLLIANNSWTYGASSYDLAAASYDAAVRDAVPEAIGSRPLLYVFPSGNGGGINVWDNGANDAGVGGTPDSVLSPGTAKNVITVGAVEQFRFISNNVAIPNGQFDTNGNLMFTTNKQWLSSTDSSNQVAGFSARGNVGLGVEGDNGRFKPDVVAPGSFIVSTRSAQWDQASYYNPTSHVTRSFLNVRLQTNGALFRDFFLPMNAVGATIEVFANPDSPVPFPDLPIFVRQAGDPVITPPQVFDFVRTNVVNMPPDGGDPIPVVNDFWRFAIANFTTQAVSFNATLDIALTNAHGNFLDELKTNLNDALGPYYRYESGTSLAAAEASGNLALMEEFLEQRTGQLFSPTNQPSPALMKAMLINGARSLGNAYDFNVRSPINFQGWGMINLPNSVPPALTNLPGATSSSMLVFDQSPTNALATGQNQTRLVSLSPDAQQLPLRITLAWTDPPGDPVTGIKLVNNLDLIVTNLDDGTVYIGNDIIQGSDFNLAWNTNTPQNLDLVNNVENVYLVNPLGSNYAITVVGRRVNVNAVTRQTNDVVQDYALVISSDPSLTNALTLQSTLTLTNGTIDADAGPTPTVPSPLVTTITNMFVGGSNVAGGILVGQRAGANTPLLGTNTLAVGNTDPIMGPVGGVITVGMTNQWHFYVITNPVNSPCFTNGAFLTFLPPTLSLPRMGVNADSLANSTRAEADIDLYVSTNSALTNLDPVALAQSIKSLGRGGSETIVISNANCGDVYYVGVKSEDMEAAEYNFLGVFSLNPFDSVDPGGNHTLTGFPAPAPIPDGTPLHPGGVYVFGIATSPIKVQRVVVTNTISHQLVGDLQGTLSHSRTGVVLINHSPDGAVVNRPYIYDDTDQARHVATITTPEGTFGPRRSDGPGSLLSFADADGIGQWMLTMADNALGHVGTNERLTVFLERKLELTNGVTATLEPGECIQYFLDVPQDATNLTISAILQSGTGPVSIQVCPESGGGCQSTTIGGLNPTNGVIVIDKTSDPPLNADTYVVTLCNLGVDDATVHTLATLQFDVNGVTPVVYTSAGAVPILDDAVTTTRIPVTNDNKIVSLEVGLRVDHPRVSDLVFHLISPSGTRVLLDENRGGLSTNGIGRTVIMTNIVPTSSNGGPEPQTNNIDTGITNWSATITYDMFNIPDQMAVYSGTNLLVDTGMVSGQGALTVTNTPGVGTILTIVMNPNGNPSPGTAWKYTVTSARVRYFYVTFTEDLAETVTPIKFAQPPFWPDTNTVVTTNFTTIMTNGFEDVPGNQFNVPAGTTFAGWHVDSGNVDILEFPGTIIPSDTGTNYVDLNGNSPGAISTNFTTIPGKVYSLSLAYCKNANIGDSFAATNTVSVTGTTNWTLVYSGPNTLANPNWFHTSFVFTATVALTQLQLASLNSGNAGMFVDSVMVQQVDVIQPRNAYFVLPEESLGQLTHENARGNWQLEVWDNRAGATNPAPNLLSWQLSFIFQNPIPLPSGLQHGQTVTNTVCPGQIQYYSVTVPAWARFATNWLISATAPGVTVWFNQIQPPSGTNGPGDFLLIGPNATTGIATIATNGTTPVLIPGQTYHLAVQNTGASCSTYQLQVDFDVTMLTLDVPVSASQASNSLPQYFSYIVNSNETGIEIQLTNLSGNVDLVASKGLPFPDLGSFAYGSFNPNADPEQIIIFTNSEPVELTPGVWYFGVFNLDPNPVNYTIVVTDMTNAVPNIIPLYLDVPYNNTNVVAAGTPDYYRYTVGSNETGVQFQLLNLSGNVDLVARKGIPLPTTNSFDYGSFNPGTNDESIIVFTNSTPVQLSPGDWYLTVYNADVADVSYTALVTDFTSPVPTIIPLTNSVPYSNTNILAAHAPDYYRYTVTSNEWAVLFQVTNLSGNVTLVASKGFPLPTASSYDYISANPGRTPEAILVFTNSNPVPLSPGDWYLGVFNADITNVSYTIVVTDFTNALPPIITLTNSIPYRNTNIVAANALDYYRYRVTSNEWGVSFQLTNLSGNVNLVLRRGLPLPSATLYDYGSFNIDTADEQILVFTNSRPVPLRPGDWYLAVINADVTDVSYTIVVTDVTNALPKIIDLSNGVPYPNVNSGKPPTTDYYHYFVSPSAARVQFEIIGPSGDMALAVRQGLPLPSLTQYDYVSDNPGTNNELVVIYNFSTPVPLTSGDWYLAAVNLTGKAVSYVVKATEWSTTGLPIVVTVSHVGSNSFCLSWNSLPGAYYFVQAKPTLPAANWVTRAFVTASDYTSTYCEPLPSVYHMFRVGQGLAIDIAPGFPAFPGAEGAGADALGGRGGSVYHVTNLGDSGPGSLRDAVSVGDRTVVFDVSGTINLLSNLRIRSSYLTIAGQTAPGDGITLQGRLTSVDHAHDVVVRFIRCRPGDIDCPSFQDDSFHFDYAKNVIADHVSGSWSIDEVLSTTDSTNVTVQWSMITESLNNSCHLKGPHGYGSLLRYGFGDLSYHHNLYADNSSRNPRLGDNITLDFVNNVVYNWGIKPGYSADDSADNPTGFTNRLNYVGNYVIAGMNSAAPTHAFEGGHVNTWIYQTNNLIDANLNGALDGVDTGWGMFAAPYTQSGAHFDMPGVTTDPAALAYEQVLDFAGASVARDTVDQRIVNYVRNQNGFIIDSQNQVGGWPSLASTAPPLDTDQDGMPDYWEITLGLDPNTPGNNNDRDGDGYTDLEEYLNWLAAPHALAVMDSPVDVDLSALAGKTGNLGFTVVSGTNGTVTLPGGSAFAHFVPSNGYSGFASFGFTITNLSTGVGFGPVPVSVLVSSVADIPLPPPPTISSVRFAGGQLTLQWNALPTQSFIVLWADTLAPAVWTPFTNIITSASGTFQFVDDGSQTGGFGPKRFYRVQVYP